MFVAERWQILADGYRVESKFILWESGDVWSAPVDAMIDCLCFYRGRDCYLERWEVLCGIPGRGQVVGNPSLIG